MTLKTEMASKLGFLIGQTSPGIDPQTGLLVDLPDETGTRWTDVVKTGAKNAAYWGLTTGMGTASAQVAGDIGGMAPDAWIGPCPIEIVTYYDFAESDSIVKYRAFGGEYFAHQGGDKNAMRIDFLLVGPYKEIVINFLRLLRFWSSGQQVGTPLFNTDESFIKQGPAANMAAGEGLWTIEHVTRRRAAQTNLNSAGLSRLSYDELVGVLGLQVNPSDIFSGPPGMPGVDKIVWDGATQAQRQQLLDDPSGSWQAKMASDPVFAGKIEKTGWATRSGIKSRERNAEYYSLVPNKNVDPNSIEKYVFQDQVFDRGTGEYVIHGDKFYELQNLGYFDFHYNYPVIVKNMIFNNMWMETVQFTHDSKDGIDAIRGHLLLRKYMRPPKLRWSANGQNPASLSSRASRTEVSHSETLSRTQTASGTSDKTVVQDKITDKYGTTPTDKRVWVWEEKRDNTPQIAEIISNFSIGIAKATLRTCIANGTNRGVGAFGPDNLTSIVSRVIV